MISSNRIVCGLSADWLVQKIIHVALPDTHIGVLGHAKILEMAIRYLGERGLLNKTRPAGGMIRTGKLVLTNGALVDIRSNSGGLRGMELDAVIVQTGYEPDWPLERVLKQKEGSRHMEILVDAGRFRVLWERALPRGVEKLRYRWINGEEYLLVGGRFRRPSVYFDDLLATTPGDQVLVIEDKEGEGAVVFICPNAESCKALHAAVVAYLAGGVHE